MTKKKESNIKTFCLLNKRGNNMAQQTVAQGVQEQSKVELLSSRTGMNPEEELTQIMSKPWYKKGWVWLVIVLLLGGVGFYFLR